MQKIIKNVSSKNLILDGNVYWHKIIKNEKIREKILSGEMSETEYDSSVEISEIFKENEDDNSKLLNNYTSSIKDDNDNEDEIIEPIYLQLDEIYSRKLNSDVFIFLEKTGFSGNDKLTEEYNKLNKKIDSYAIIYNDDDIITTGTIISSKIVEFYESLERGGDDD